MARTLKNRRFRNGFPTIWKTRNREESIAELGKNRFSSEVHFLRTSSGTDVLWESSLKMIAKTMDGFIETQF